MKRNVLFFAATIACTAMLFFAACTKNSATQTSLQSGLAPATDLSAALQQSAEFSAFVAATNNIIGAVDFKAINQKDARSARVSSEKPELNKQEFTAVLLLQHITPGVYFTNSSIQQKAIKDFQAKYGITNEQNAALWQSVIMKNKSLFTVNSKVQLPDVGGIIDCLTETATTFAATTAICLALREIPIIGEQLFRACETDAVNTLIEDAIACIGL